MKITQGIDLMCIQRIEDAIEKHGAAFLDRIFSQAEQAYCESKKMKFEHYAARFAAKEAFVKALPGDYSSVLEWNKIEIRNNEWGAPSLVLNDDATQKLDLSVGTSFSVSLSHERDYAIACVMVMQPK